jgi:hypothetical protein
VAVASGAADQLEQGAAGDAVPDAVALVLDRSAKEEERGTGDLLVALVTADLERAPGASHRRGFGPLKR